MLLITMRYSFIPISLVQSSLAAQNVGKCMEEKEILYTADGSINQYIPFGKKF